jgi:hypothetical protein
MRVGVYRITLNHFVQQVRTISVLGRREARLMVTISIRAGR